MKDLLQAAKAETTWAAYNRSNRSFQQFYITQYSVPPTMPYSPSDISAFVSFLHLKRQAPSTVSTHLSAISYFHKLKNLSDPTQSFLVRQLQLGGRRLHQQPDSRQPITKAILHQLYHAVPKLSPTHYMTTLYQSLFLLCFHGFLRVGEVTATAACSTHTLTLAQITIPHHQSQPSSLTITFNSFKHSKGTPYKINILTQQGPCPVKAMVHYLQLRGLTQGFLFVNLLKHPLTRYQFASFLSTTLKFIGQDPDKFNTHSFRIGAATHAATQGFSALQIKAMGRWQSDAYLKYLRQPVVQMV